MPEIQNRQTADTYGRKQRNRLIWNDIYKSKKQNFIDTEFNLVPLAEMLSVEGISAGEMANLFDELAYDCTRTIVELQMADLSPRTVLHEETDRFLYLLRELREVFRQCSA